MSKKPEMPANPLEQPATPQQVSSNLIPENILQQQTSVASKSKEAADLKEAVDIFGKTLNSAINEIKELLKPKDPPPPAAPVAPVIPETPPPKKSAFKTIDDELNKIWGY